MFVWKHNKEVKIDRDDNRRSGTSTFIGISIYGIVVTIEITDGHSHGGKWIVQNYRFALLLFFCRTNKKNDSATSSSDSESDADYVPSTKELKDEANRSADEDSDASESPEETGDDDTGKRKKRNNVRKRKKTKITPEPEQTEQEAECEPEPSKNIDDIWNDFKKDVESKQPQISKIKPSDQSDNQAKPEPEPEKPKTKTITELFEFAGEAVQVEKEVPLDTPPPKPVPTTSAPKRGGMASILGQIGKKNKLSVLEKSKLDWNSFKKQEGIEEDLQVHNKGKDGFLERQDFLQRTDLRQFEIEKAMRSTSRRKWSFLLFFIRTETW